MGEDHVTLATHEADGLTNLDIELAKKMDVIADASTAFNYQSELSEPITCLCSLAARR